MGARVVILDHHGNWINGSDHPIPTATSIEVELWAFRDGLQLAKDCSVDNFEIEVDVAPLIASLLKHIFREKKSICRCLGSFRDKFPTPDSLR